MRKVLILVSDQQLVTGISILKADLVNFQRKSQDSASIYHLFMIQNLASLNYLCFGYALDYEGRAIADYSITKPAFLQHLAFTKMLLVLVFFFSCLLTAYNVLLCVESNQ